MLLSDACKSGLIYRGLLPGNVTRTFFSSDFMSVFIIWLIITKINKLHSRILLNWSCNFRVTNFSLNLDFVVLTFQQKPKEFFLWGDTIMHQLCSSPYYTFSFLNFFFLTYHTFSLILCHVSFLFSRIFYVIILLIIPPIFILCHIISCFICYAHTGLARSTIANGCSMVAYKKVQQLLIDSRVQ